MQKISNEILRILDVYSETAGLGNIWVRAGKLILHAFISQVLEFKSREVLLELC